MNAKELLLECAVKLRVQSDYALAKEMKIPRMRISDYKAGKVKLDTYALVKIAETLGRDPLELLAQYEAEHEKNDVKRDYWQGFILRARRRAGLFIMALLCTLSLLSGYEKAAQVGGFRRRRLCA